MRVYEVKNAFTIENSRNLIGMNVDLGEDYGIIEIVAELAQFVKPKDLIGKKFIFIANLKLKKC